MSGVQFMLDLRAKYGPERALKAAEPTPNTAKDAGLAAAQQCADSNTPVCAATALYAPARSSNGAPKALYEGV